MLLGLRSRWGSLLPLLLLWLIIGWWANAQPTRQADVLQHSSTSVGGLYGLEQSSTLPGASGPTSRSYRWSNGNLQVPLWPNGSHSRMMQLEYLAPFSPTMLQFEQTQALSLPMQPELRQLSIFVPAEVKHVNAINQPNEQNGRPLGLLLSNLNWQELGATGWANLRTATPFNPSNLLLLGGVALVLSLGLARHWVALFGTGLSLGLAVLAWSGNWLNRAAINSLSQLVLVAALAAGAWYGWQRWQRPINWRWLLVAIWLITTVCLWTPTVQYDGVGYYAYLRSAGIDHDFDFSNEFSQTPLELNTGVKITKTGYAANPWSVGPAMAFAPLWWLGHGSALLGGWPSDGYSQPYLALTTWGSALAGLIFILSCEALLRRQFSPKIAALATISVYLASNLLYYSLFQGAYAHSLSAACVSLMALASVRLREQPSLGRWAQLGLTMGATIVSYWIGALVLILPALIIWPLLVGKHRRAWPDLLKGLLLAALTGLLIVLPQLAMWKLLYGSWLTIPQGGNFATPRSSQLWPMLVGSLYGMLWWTPIYVLGLLGLGLSVRQRQAWPYLAAVIIYLVYISRLPDWHGSGAFGLRRLTTIAPCLAWGVAALLQRWRRWPGAAIGLLASFGCWNLALMARYITYAIPRGYPAIAELPLSAILLSNEPLELSRLGMLLGNGWFGSQLSNFQARSVWILLGLLGSLAGVLALGSWLGRANSPSLNQEPEQVGLGD
ncbi:hypothetical protein [Herpetosiphon geysericola]|uniref:Glycosyltransferase RgtA/B/C/D-like domain-containing protein n=1 Tax=Herpetosiphon geysericola TaxID=70996 RepID=A0A0P6XTW1_9CHLR|nr:hypothetical protein [Herpetosiphon geysericola]KPL86816.1 hypothetical protein SE18_12745 [Herpetosiphon geysericola]